MLQAETSIKQAEGILSYAKYGKGQNILLAFHGFGQTKDYYKEFGRQWGEDFSIYSFDIFYHGRSYWEKGEEVLSLSIWKGFMERFFESEGISSFYLAGYSMGGKFALTTMMQFPEMTKGLLLIAPDGVKTSFWYSLATYPTAFRRVFRNTIVRPKVFFNLLNLMNTLRVIDKGVIKFARNQMNSKKKRRKVYYSWVVFRELQYSQQELARKCNEFQISLLLVLGKYDKIMTLENMQPFLNQLNHHHMIMLEQGHNTLIADTAREVSPEALLSVK